MAKNTKQNNGKYISSSSCTNEASRRCSSTPLHHAQIRSSSFPSLGLLFVGTGTLEGQGTGEELVDSGRRSEGTWGVNVGVGV